MKDKKVKLASFIIIFLSLICFNLSATMDSGLSARELYQKGVEAYLKLDRFTAYEYFHAAIRSNPNYVKPIEGLAFLFFQMSQYKQALVYVKRAQELDRYNINLKNLEGRIYIGLTEFDNALAVFETILIEEPNNVEALLGLSDLEVVYGTWRKAITGYESILHSYPQNIRAMLSLVLIYDEISDEENAEKFIKKSILLYPDDVSVRYLAANHYRKYGKMEEAKRQATLALQIDSKYRDAALLLSYIYLDSGELTNAIEILLPFIKIYEEDYILFYTLAYAYEAAGQIDEAISLYNKALNIRNSDEFSRNALENSIIDNKDFDDPNRLFLANYHFNLGDQFLDQSNLSSFYQHYRKGLQIKNRDYRGLKGYANYFKLNGNQNKFYSLLEELIQMDPEDQDIKDQHNIYKRLTQKSVTRKWDLENLTKKRDEYKLSFFAMDIPQQVIHYQAQKVLLATFEHILNGYLNINFASKSTTVTSFAEAFKEANSNGSEYFFIFDLTEKERSIYIKVDIFFSESGILLDSFSVLETGNHRLQKALIFIADKISYTLPLKGNLVRFEFDEGILNLGQMDGLEVDDELFIIRKGFLNQGLKGFSFDYDDNNVLGTFKVTNVDDLLSEGEVKNRFYYDLINEGDHIIKMPEKVQDFRMGEYIPPDLYKDLLKLK